MFWRKQEYRRGFPEEIKAHLDFEAEDLEARGLEQDGAVEGATRVRQCAGGAGTVLSEGAIRVAG